MLSILSLLPVNVRLPIPLEVALIAPDQSYPSATVTLPSPSKVISPDPPWLNTYDPVPATWTSFALTTPAKLTSPPLYAP